MASSTAAADSSNAIGDPDTIGISDIIGDSNTEEGTEVCQASSSDANCSLTSPTVSLLDRLHSPRELIRARKEKESARYPSTRSHDSLPEPDRISPFDPKSGLCLHVNKGIPWS